MKRFIFSIIAALSLTSSAIHASQRDDMLAALANCANMVDAAARHACFDQLVPQLQSLAVPARSTGTPAQPAATESGDSWFGFDVSNFFSSPSKKQATPEQFGGENISAAAESVARNVPQSADIESISAGVVRYWVDSRGYFIVSLDNGQIWSQLAGDDSFAHFHKSGRNNVVISRGVLRSYNLSLNGQGQEYKVRRIK